MRHSTAAASASEADAPSVRELGEADHGRWDTFVDNAPDATFCHRVGWKRVIERAFGHRTWYLMAEDAGRVRGVLPLARVKSWLFGDALISLPFCVYGGIVAEDDAAAMALDAAARDLAHDLGVGHLEYRNRRPFHDDWPRKTQYVTFRREIASDPDDNLKAIPRKQRAMVRKGIKSGLDVSVDHDTNALHWAYSRSVHRLGTPVFARRYFDILCEEFAGQCDVLTLRHGGEIISSVLSFYFRDEVLPYYGGGTDAARALYANDFMYWALMEHARERGFRVFDYGRSKIDTGSYRFKKHWGFQPEPLHYECELVRSKSLPDNSPMNPKFRTFIAVWQRMPLAFANVLGPHIVRNLG